MRAAPGRTYSPSMRLPGLALSSVLVSSVLLAGLVTPTTARADVAQRTDQTRDVVRLTGSTVRAAEVNKAVDITTYRIDHSSRAVTVGMQVRDLVRQDFSFVTTIAVEGRGTFTVPAQRVRRQFRFALTAPDGNQVPCNGLYVVPDFRNDYVETYLPLSCLGTRPDWVRVGSVLTTPGSEGAGTFADWSHSNGFPGDGRPTPLSARVSR